MEPQLIAAIVGLLLALTGLVKVWTDVLKIRAERADTKAARDKDSLEIHDAILKHTMHPILIIIHVY